MDRQFLIDNLYYRISVENPEIEINYGLGYHEPEIVVIQSGPVSLNDATAGALNQFGLLKGAYRIPHKIVESSFNRSYVIEMVSLLKPRLVVVSGRDAVSLVKNKSIAPAAFNKLAGTKIKIHDLTKYVAYVTIDPNSYVNSASRKLKDRGKLEWKEISTLVKKV